MESKGQPVYRVSDGTSEQGIDKDKSPSSDSKVLAALHQVDNPVAGLPPAQANPNEVSDEVSDDDSDDEQEFDNSNFSPCCWLFAISGTFCISAGVLSYLLEQNQDTHSSSPAATINGTATETDDFDALASHYNLRH